MKLRFYLFYLLLPLTLQSCVLNNPYRDVESNQNYVYNTFINPPKHLDPVISYSAGEYVWLQQIYEQPLQYHYLKRPEILIPMTAREVPQPVYYDKNGQKLTKDPPSEQVARAVYTVRIKPGILYQDHPCFAKTESGQHAYLNLTDADMVGIADLNDFPLKGTREVSSADYIYQIKRMAHPKLPCPIFSTMAKYIIGLDVLEQQLAGELKRIRAERKQAGGVLYNQEMDERENPIHLDLDQFDTDGLRVLDKYTYQIILKRKYPQLVYWLAMPFFAPIPNSTV